MAEKWEPRTFRRRIVSKASQLARDLEAAAEEWDEAAESGDIARTDLVLNVQMAARGLGYLESLYYEVVKKLRAAKAGVHRYRELEYERQQQDRHKKKA